MKVRFKNGTVYECSNPIEQKIFKGGEPSGWICSLTFDNNLNSAEIDNTVTAENVSEMVFLSETDEVAVSLTGYEKLTSAIIRHSAEGTRADIQLTKGI